MKNLNIAVITLTLTLELPALETVGPRPGDNALFAIWEHGLEPIALLTEKGRFIEPPSSAGGQPPEVVQVWLEQFLKPATVLGVYQNGRSLGLFTIGEYTPPGCSGFGLVAGSLQAENNTPHEKPYLSFSSRFPGKKAYFGTSADPRLRQTAVSMSLELYSHQGVPEDRLKDFETIDFVSFTLYNGKVKAFSISSRLKRTHPEEDPLCPTDTLLLVAEKVGERYVYKVVAHKEYRTEKKADSCEKYHFVSTFATGKQDDKFLLSGSGYEWNWYEIYQRDGSGQYRQVFKGGGGGC